MFKRFFVIIISKKRETKIGLFQITSKSDLINNFLIQKIKISNHERDRKCQLSGEEDRF